MAARAEDLPSTTGRFALISFGRSLHWMEPDGIRAAVDRLAAPGAVVAVCGAGTAGAPWTTAYDALRRAWRDPAAGGHHHPDIPSLFGPIGFAVSHRLSLSVTRRPPVEDLIARLPTYSSLSHVVTAGRLPELEAEAHRALAPFATDGHLVETVISRATLLRRQA